MCRLAARALQEKPQRPGQHQLVLSLVQKLQAAEAPRQHAGVGKRYKQEERCAMETRPPALEESQRHHSGLVSQTAGDDAQRDK